MSKNIETVTKAQREAMERYGQRIDPISFILRDKVTETIADFAIAHKVEILEVETHRAFTLVAFTDGAVHKFGSKSGAYYGKLAA